MTNNFELLKKYISVRNCNFDNCPDHYYVVELMRRGKDNPDIPAANYHFKNYYINKISDLDKYKDDIKFLCDGLRMRAYFSLNYKSYKQVMMDTIAETARRAAAGDFNKPYSIYESCSGSYCANGNKTWLIDVDKEDAEEYKCSVTWLADWYENIITNSCEPFKPAIMIVPTKSGMHIICHPFNIEKFNEKCIENGFKPHDEKKHEIIKKNHLTLLYENL